MAEKYFQQLKVINKIYKPNTAAYLMLLLDKHKYWASKPDQFYKLTNRRFTGHFYISRSTFTKEINLKRTAQNTAESVLKADGIIHMDPLDGHANWYTINHEMLQEKIDAYYGQLEEEVEAVTDYPFDESEEYEEWIFGSDKADQDDDNEQATPLKKSNPARLNHAATNNKELKIKNNNKVSNATYVPDGTESIDSCIKNINNSCIKNKESATKPPGAHAQSGDELDELITIIDDYNEAMELDFKSGEKEYTTVISSLEQLKEVRKYFKPSILNKIWDDYGDDYTKSIEHRRISAFIKCGFLPKLAKYGPLITKANDEEIDQRLDNLFRRYGDQISSLVQKEGYYLSYGSLEPKDASIHFPPKEHRRVRLHLYHKHIKNLLPEEEIHDMMELEV